MKIASKIKDLLQINPAKKEEQGLLELRSFATMSSSESLSPAEKIKKKLKSLFSK
jgi:hypothetical protein